MVQRLFSSEKYPSHRGFVGQGFTDLKKALQLDATKCGYNVTSNGGAKSLQTFTCKHTRKYWNNIKSRLYLQYRRQSFHNNKEILMAMKEDIFHLSLIGIDHQT